MEFLRKFFISENICIQVRDYVEVNSAKEFSGQIYSLLKMIKLFCIKGSWWMTPVMHNHQL